MHFQQSVSVYQALDTQRICIRCFIARQVERQKQLSILAENNLLYKYVSALGRIEYDYNGRYLFNLVAAKDGSSRFDSGNNLEICGSVSVLVGFFSEENFINQHLRFLGFFFFFLEK